MFLFDMKHLGLFEGIGGFSLAAQWAGWQTPVMVEWNQYCQAVLKKNFPDASTFGDIHEFDGRPYAGKIDVITGGFPCQPFSHAGLRAGADDDRYLWPEMLRVIREVAPPWVVGENVAGLLTMDGGRVFAGILSDLENAGYSTETYLIPALAVGAPHLRNRVWIVAHSDDNERYRTRNARNGRGEPANENIGFTADAQGERFGKTGRHSGRPTERIAGRNSAPTTDARKHGLQRGEQPGAPCEGSRASRSTTEQNRNGGQWAEHWYEVATRICRVDDGFPVGMDGTGNVPTKTKKGKAHRLEALGNAIVPEIAYQIFQAINTHEHRNTTGAV